MNVWKRVHVKSAEGENGCLKHYLSVSYAEIIAEFGIEWRKEREKNETFSNNLSHRYLLYSNMSGN